MGSRCSVRSASSSVLALLTATVLPAQFAPPPPVLTMVIVPGRTEARIDALPDAVVVWFASSSPGHTPLPGGQSLGLDQPLVGGIALANSLGHATFAATFPVGAFGGLTVHGQAVVWDTSQPLDATTALAVSAPRAAQVPLPGAFADLYVLFGQSNAEGSADAAALPARLRGPQPRCRMWNDSAASFEAMENGVNTHTYSPTSWCGPELTLGEGLADAHGTVHLVKCAFAMTALGPTPGPWNEWGFAAAELYAILRFRIGRAAVAVRAQGLVPRVRGIFMMQGESDATDLRQAGRYAVLLQDLIGGMRNDLVAAGLADAAAPIPFVLGAVDARLPTAFFPYTATVRQAQRETVGLLPSTALVQTSTFGLRSDGVHFDTLGVQQLGVAMAAAFLAL